MNAAKQAPDAKLRRTTPIEVEITVEAGDWPPAGTLQELAEAAIDAACAELGWTPDKNAEVSLLFANDARIAELNAMWRGKEGPTNVLSFPAGFPADTDGETEMLGDIAIAFETVCREADIELKSFNHHLTHLIVHGFLHLCGYDHLDDEEAEEMEGLEIAALARLDIPDPYAVTHSLQD